MSAEAGERAQFVLPSIDGVEPGQFAAPDLATVKRIRLEVERHKRRLNECSPHRVWPARDGAEL
jgi:hypothetical protein